MPSTAEQARMELSHLEEKIRESKKNLKLAEEAEMEQMEGWVKRFFHSEGGPIELKNVFKSEDGRGLHRIILERRRKGPNFSSTTTVSTLTIAGWNNSIMVMLREEGE